MTSVGIFSPASLAKQVVLCCAIFCVIKTLWFAKLVSQGAHLKFTT